MDTAEGTDNANNGEEENIGCEIFTEGKVKIVVNANAETFYNPVQEFNRDLTILVLRQFVQDRAQKNVSTEFPPPKKRSKHDHSKPSEKIQILDALSASGLRALRFSKEVSGVDFVVANDFSADAVEAIKRNAKLNDLEHLIRPSYGDAVDVMMAHRTFDKRFHVIDLDPYGSAATFLDSAVQAVADEGILMVTCTDTATLCGNTPEACFNKYASVPLRHKCCHEFALRILLKCIGSHAARHGRYIRPLLSVSVDFYVRCFVQVFTSASKAKDSVTKLANVLACSSCRSLEFQPLVKKTVVGASIRFSNATIQSKMLGAPTATHYKSHDDNCAKKVDGESNNEKDAPESNGTCGSNENNNSSNNNGTTATNSPITAADDSIQSNYNNNKSSCTHCGIGPIHLAGPIYVDPLHDEEFVGRLLSSLKAMPEEERLGTYDRLAGLLTVVSEEVHEVPLYYESDQVMNAVRCSAPRHAIVRSAILNAGYRCSISHCNPKALKTNAPVAFLWDVCRAWAKQNKVDPKKIENHPVARNILMKESSREVSFALNPRAMAKSKTDCLLRFPDNKGKNWGPKCKAKGSITSNTAQYQPSKL